MALARALVIRPRCLLLDEPLSNLDAKLRLEMRLEIRRICKEFKLTTVYVTHDQKEALSIADRMAILDGGRILQVGSPREIYRRPRRRKIAAFIGEADFIPGRVVGRMGDQAMVETTLGLFTGGWGDPAAKSEIGTDVALAIRPEAWVLGRDARGQNAIRGRIGDSIYLGETAQYAFTTAAGVTLKILELNPRLIDRPREGELYASVDPEDVVVLTE